MNERSSCYKTKTEHICSENDNTLNNEAMESREDLPKSLQLIDQSQGRIPIHIYHVIGWKCLI